MAKKKRKISLKAIQAALKSPKTPEHLRAGLLKKYGHLFTKASYGNAPKDYHRKEADDSYKKFLKTRDPYDKGLADAHYASVFKKNPKEATNGYISERVKSPNKKVTIKDWIGEEPLYKLKISGYDLFQLKRISRDFYELYYGKKSLGEYSNMQLAILEVNDIIKKKKCKVPVELQRKLKLKRNPAGKPVLIYDKITAIEATKGKRSHWSNEPFRHDFTSGAKIYGNPDGSLTIKGKKALWKNKKYSSQEVEDLGGKI